MQQTLVLIKPDAVEKDVWLDIIKIYEKNGLTIQHAEIFAPFPVPRAKTLYLEHEGKDYYDNLIDFMTNGTVIALCVVGDDAVVRVRKINGATKPREAADGTIRKLYGTEGCRNAVHGSANPVDAERELRLIFLGDYHFFRTGQD